MTLHRGGIYRYTPVLPREGQSLIRVVLSVDSINTDAGIPVVYGMHVLEDDPESTLAIPVGGIGWAFALKLEQVLKSRLGEPLGHATSGEMETIEWTLKAVLGLD